ncbi:MAG: T9SS C-terminal target domain-containing protein [Sphingobacteriales bacterium]|nr:MAG: T9SS C-terminal target domain-containing protein [Sphingobacteriales bacterium]
MKKITIIFTTIFLSLVFTNASKAWIVCWFVQDINGCNWVCSFGNGPCCNDCGCMTAWDANGVAYPNQFCNEGIIMQNSGTNPAEILVSASGKYILNHEVFAGIITFITDDDKQGEIYIETEDGQSILLDDLHNLAYDYTVAAKIFNDGRVEVYIDSLKGRIINTDLIGGKIEQTRKTYHYKLSNYLNPQIHIYPNPASDEISIEIPNTISISEKIISITSVDGKKIIQKSISGEIEKIDISKFESGIYFVRITDKISGDQIGIERFVKE